jgi:hypothetical protein
VDTLVHAEHFLGLDGEGSITAPAAACDSLHGRPDRRCGGGTNRDPLVDRWIGLLKEGLIPLTLGLILASGVAMMRTSDHDTLTVVISLATAAFVVFSRRNPLWAIAAGTFVSIAALRLGVLQV